MNSTLLQKTYAKIIISEISLPVEKKMIKPVELGGVAGGELYNCTMLMPTHTLGEKYVVNSIMFKFAVDHRGIFTGSDEKAAKVAGFDSLDHTNWI